MKQWNPKSVQSFLLLLYCILVAVFIIAVVVGRHGYLAKEASINRERENASILLLNWHNALRNVRTASLGMLLEQPEQGTEQTLRNLYELRSASQALFERRYLKGNNYRQAADSLQNSVNQAFSIVSSCARNDKNRQEAFSGYYKLNAILLDAEKNGNTLEKVYDGEIRELSRNAQSYFNRLLLMMIVFFSLSFVLTYLTFSLTRFLLKRSLKGLCEGTKALRSGDLNYRFRNITPDEIGQVKYDFNIMAHQISCQSETLRTANRELKDKAEELIAAHQHKDRFLSNMSHELRTPLNSIIGFSELLETRAERLEPDKVKSYGSRILTAADHLLSLITSLLDLAKSGAGVLKPVFADFDLTASARETVEILSPLAWKKNLKVESDLCDDVMFHGDQRMIKQIIINLFSNAVKYTVQGSIMVTLKRMDETIELGVKDTGIGIPEKEHKNLFQDFYRVDNGPDFMVEGTGIGLALSRRLAALHQGKITFESHEGEGSLFTLHLPAGPIKKID